MKKTVLYSLSLLFLMGWGVGCAAKQSTVWISKPYSVFLDKAPFSVAFEPTKNGSPYFSMFHLTVTNKTESDLHIDWNKTRYIYNNQVNGMFIFKGIKPDDLKNGAVPNEIVGPGRTFEINVAPQRLVAFAPLKGKSSSEISTGVLPAGENGISLVMQIGDKEFVERLRVVLSENKP